MEKEGKKNIYSGRVLEIEGLPDLKVEQAFELADASAERSASGCTIKLNREPIAEYLTSNIVMLKWLLSQGYRDARTINRRIEAMQAWLEAPQLMEADSDAEYREIIDIDLNTITEPILCAPNDPDDARLLSEVAGDRIDEVFIGSCMTNIGHFRAASRLLDKMGKVIPTRMWIVPPTRMDQAQLREEGHYAIFARAGARTEPPGCSLCMGNQARVADNATVVSTSTRNFPNRLGQGANVYLASSELSAVAGVLGRLPTVKEYMNEAGELNAPGRRHLPLSQLQRNPRLHRRRRFGGAGAALRHLTNPTGLPPHHQRLPRMQQGVGGNPIPSGQLGDADSVAAGDAP